MHAEARARHGIKIDEVGGKNRARQFRRDTLLVDAMARLVPDGKEAAGQPILAEAAGDADIRAGEGNLERMDGVIKPPALEIIAHASRDRPRKRLLPLDGIMARQKVVANRRRL